VDGAELPYWIESWDFAGQSAKVWVNVTKYIRWGEHDTHVVGESECLEGLSNGDATFVFFDDFDDGNLDG